MKVRKFRTHHWHWAAVATIITTAIAVPTTAHYVNRVPIAPVPVSASCHSVGLLPDPACTPGVVLTTDTQKVCTPGYSRSVRNVSPATKQQVELMYGYSSNPGEIDHLISLELGGSNDIKNLWPESSPSFKTKDQLENQLHREVCTGQITIEKAQQEISQDWTKAQ